MSDMKPYHRAKLGPHLDTIISLRELGYPYNAIRQYLKKNNGVNVSTQEVHRFHTTRTKKNTKAIKQQETEEGKEIPTYTPSPTQEFPKEQTAAAKSYTDQDIDDLLEPVEEPKRLFTKIKIT